MRSAILFDMNGVLIDDEDLHLRAFRDVSARLGLDLSDDDYTRFFAGKTDRDGFAAFLSERDNSLLPQLEHLLEQKSSAYQSLAATDLRAYTGASDLIMRLDERGHDLGLVTSSTRPEAEAVLRFLQLEDVFDVVVTAEDASEGKPSPQPYLRASVQLRRPTSECVVIEDSPSGVASAKKAGMRCIAIASTHNPAVLSEADVVVDTIDGLDSDSRVLALL